MATLRVVLDTNVLLSGIAYPSSVPGQIIAAWRGGSLDVTLSMFILDELRRVLPRLEHRHDLSAAEMDDLVDVLAIEADIVEPNGIPDADLRDVNDQPVLATFLCAHTIQGAAYLVTGDKDLLALAARYPIITPSAFWAKHGGI